MKRVIWCILLVFFLSGCSQPEPVANRIAERELTRLEGELSGADRESLALQEKLAMWYNLNLLKERDPDFRVAYGQILYYTDGIMGSLEIPGQAFHQPIYHGTESGKGFGHDPNTAFPVGGTGNHPVLVAAESLPLAEGDTFIVHILGCDLTYRVAAIREKQDTSAVPGVDYCSLITGDGDQILALRWEETEDPGTFAELPEG